MSQGAALNTGSTTFRPGKTENPAGRPSSCRTQKGKNDEHHDDHDAESDLEGPVVSRRAHRRRGGKSTEVYRGQIGWGKPKARSECGAAAGLLGLRHPGERRRIRRRRRHGRGGSRRNRLLGVRLEFARLVGSLGVSELRNGLILLATEGTSVVGCAPIRLWPSVLV